MQYLCNRSLVYGSEDNVNDVNNKMPSLLSIAKVGKLVEKAHYKKRTALMVCPCSYCTPQSVFSLQVQEYSSEEGKNVGLLSATPYS